MYRNLLVIVVFLNVFIPPHLALLLYNSQLYLTYKWPTAKYPKNFKARGCFDLVSMLVEKLK